MSFNLKISQYIKYFDKNNHSAIITPLKMTICFKGSFYVDWIGKILRLGQIQVPVLVFGEQDYFSGDFVYLISRHIMSAYLFL